MRARRVKRGLALLMALLLGLSGIPAGDNEVLYEQSFNSLVLTGVTPGNFTHVVRPQDEDNPDGAYTTDGADGALQSAPAIHNVRMKTAFGSALSGHIRFEGEFRYESKDAASGGIKFFELYDSANKSIMMLTIGNSNDNGFEVRPVYKTASGSGVVSSVRVNNEVLAYKTWHRLAVQIDTEAGTMNIYVSGNDGSLYKLVEGGYPWGYGAGVGIADIDNVQSYHTHTNDVEHMIPFLIDNIAVRIDDGADDEPSGGVPTETATINQNFDSDLAGISFAEGDFEIVERPADGIETYASYVPDGTQDGALLSKRQTGGKMTAGLIAAQSGNLTFEGDFRLEAPVGGTGGAVQFYDFYTASGVSFLKFGSAGAANQSGYRLRAAYLSNGSWMGTATTLQLGGADVSYRTWHKLKVELNTNMGVMSIWVDDELLLDGVTVSLSNGASVNLKSIQSYHNADTTESTGRFLIDRLRLFTDEPTAPTAANVQIQGIPMVNGLLGLTADLFDVNNDPLGTPLYQWQRADNPAGSWSDIPVATDQQYVPATEDIGLYIRVGVTPVSTVEPFLGERVFSSATGPIEPAADPPSISGDVAILGTPEVGNALTADYLYESSGSGHAEGATEFLWERAAAANGEYVPVATTVVYTPLFADKDHYFRVTVTPVDSIGLSGTPKTSAAVMVVSDLTELVFHVAPTGSDSNPGTSDQPFATLDQARTAVRTSGAAGAIPITVYFHAGDYRLTEGVLFTTADSGSSDYPVVYRDYGDGEVRFLGSRQIDVSQAAPVTDTTVLERIISPEARNEIRMIDLAAQGLTDIPQIPDSYGFSRGGWQPMEFYYNHTPLTLARWPNASFLTVNYTDSKTSNYTLGFDDIDSRTALWDKEQVEGDMFLWGNIGYAWAGSANRIAIVDETSARLTTQGTTAFAPMLGRKFYVFNLLEEIDLPGEYYVDRINGVLYFYPPADTSASSLEVSTLTDSMLVMNGVSYITFEGLTFTMTRANIVNAVNTEGITINNSELSHTSSNAVTLSGTSFTLENSHVYDLGGSAGVGGLHITGGDRQNLIASGHVIRNNRLHAGDRVYTIGQAPLIHAVGVGHIIEHNEIYDASAYAVRFVDGNDIQFNYNEVYDAVRLSSDAGAVTWGRDPTMLGIEIKHNYFHDIGNDMGGYGQQSVFTDDGAAGGKIYGNIFYKGTLTADQGGSMNNSFVLKTNGGQYMTVENNVFVNAPVAAHFLSWNTGFPSGLQGRWWLWVHDRYGTPSNIWAKMQEVGFDSDIWKSHYQNTQWKWLNELFSTTFFNEHIQNESDAQALHAIALNKAPVRSGWFDNNVMVQVDYGHRSDNDNATIGTSYMAQTDLLAGGQSMFVDYGADFKLTAAGLAAVRNQLPGFENIPTELIGLQPFVYDNAPFHVGGSAPLASDVRIEGTLAVGGSVRAEYVYQDPDGDGEGASRINWYYADEEEGVFRPMIDMTGKEVKLAERYDGKFIKFEITPYDNRMMHGESKWSEVAYVVLQTPGDKTALSAKFVEAFGLADTATVGDDEGEYTEAVMDAFLAAIAEAQRIIDRQNASQYDVNATLVELERAIAVFVDSVNMLSSMERFAVNGILQDEDGWDLHTLGPLGLENGTLRLSSGGSFGSYDAEKYLNNVFTFTYKHALEGGWNGIYFRQKNPDALSWAADNAGYLVAFKPDLIELQTRDGISTRTLDEFPNLYIFDDTEHLIEVGAYDVEGIGTRVILRVDGQEVFNLLQQDGRLYDQEGYFGVYVGSGSVTIEPVPVDKSELLDAIGEAASLMNSAEQGELYGQYPEAAFHALEAAIAQAQAAAASLSIVQVDVNREKQLLYRAISAFTDEMITEATASLAGTQYAYHGHP